MLKPGRVVEYAPNLFNTYLSYKENLGVSQAELIREFNAVLGKNYNVVTIYRWKTNEKSLPDSIMTNFIVPVLPDLYRWYFKNNGFSGKTIDFDALSAAFCPVIKKEA